MILNKNQRIYFYLFGIFSLIISSIMGEDSSGGSKLDKEITRQFIDNFLISFDNGIKYFLNSGQVQSPIFYILVSIIEKTLGFNFLKYSYLLISSVIPIIFYISLKKKFKGVDKNILFLISLIIFLSPYFRSSATWITTDNFAIIFFILSVNKYLDLEKKYTNQNMIFCIFYLSIAVYIRQYYIIFFLLYFLKFFEILNLKKIFSLAFLTLIIFIPFIIYYYYFFRTNIIYQSLSNNVFGINILNNVLIFSSLYLFYTIPFYINNFTEIKKNIFKNLNKFIIIFFVFGVIYFYYPITLDTLGGGVFIKISNILDNKIIFLASSFFGTFLILSNLNKNNFVVYLCLIFAFPTIIIYQKYYDPLLIMTILTLTKGGMLNQIFNLNRINLLYLYSYFIFFLIISNLYYSFNLWI